MAKKKTIRKQKKIPKNKLVRCPTCRGTGNLDEAVGFTLDCARCGGSGWIKK